MTVTPLRAVAPATVRRPLRVAVMSRHAVTRAGLAQLLSRGGDQYSVVTRPIETGYTRDHDVVIVDLTGLTDPTGLVGRIRSDLAILVDQDVPVVALTRSPCPSLHDAALDMGVADTVSLDIPAAALLQALERAAARQTTDLAVHRRPRSAAVRAITRLSERELMVLELIGTGLTNHDIADRLFLSINTVKTYIRSAYRKIGVSRRAEAVLWVVRRPVQTALASSGGRPSETALSIIEAASVMRSPR